MLENDKSEKIVAGCFGFSAVGCLIALIIFAVGVAIIPFAIAYWLVK